MHFLPIRGCINKGTWVTFMHKFFKYKGLWLSNYGLKSLEESSLKEGKAASTLIDSPITGQQGLVEPCLECFDFNSVSS